MATILVVDDEANIIELAELYLTNAGHKILSAYDGEEALRLARTAKPDLMVLDLMLPQVDGFEVCRQIRAQQESLPILMLTARDEDYDKILGLELGADDYMTKPFNPRELVARVKAILRRASHSSSEDHSPIRVGNLTIDPSRFEVHVGERLIPLRAQEFEVLCVLARHAGRVLTREQLLEKAWGYDFYGQTRTVDVHVAQLRRKLAGSGVAIETVTGVGYKLVG